MGNSKTTKLYHQLAREEATGAAGQEVTTKEALDLLGPDRCRQLKAMATRQRENEILIQKWQRHLAYHNIENPTRIDRQEFVFNATIGNLDKEGHSDPTYVNAAGVANSSTFDEFIQTPLTNYRPK